MNRRVAKLSIFAMTMVLLAPVESFAAVKDLASMLQQLESNIPYVRQMVAAFCYTVGIGLILKSVFMLKKYGQMRTMMASDTSMAKPMIVLFVGIGLFAIPDLIDSSMQTLYNYSSSSVMQYPPASNWSSVINPLITITKLLGLIVFVKGWMMLAKFGADGGAASQQGVGGKAVMHMIGGILAMNIVATIDIIKGSLGI